jgi:hypothetical protein
LPRQASTESAEPDQEKKKEKKKEEKGYAHFAHLVREVGDETCQLKRLTASACCTLLGLCDCVSPMGLDDVFPSGLQGPPSSSLHVAYIVHICAHKPICPFAHNLQSGTPCMYVRCTGYTSTGPPTCRTCIRCCRGVQGAWPFRRGPRWAITNRGMYLPTHGACTMYSLRHMLPR